MTRIGKKQKPNIEECVQNTTNDSSVGTFKFFETIVDLIVLPFGIRWVLLLNTPHGDVGGWIGLAIGLGLCLLRIMVRYHKGQTGVREEAATIEEETDMRRRYRIEDRWEIIMMMLMMAICGSISREIGGMLDSGSIGHTLGLIVGGLIWFGFRDARVRVRQVRMDKN